MNELDRIYEEIERLLEVNRTKSWNSSSNSKFIDENTALKKANDEGLSYLGRGGESGGQYLATKDPNSQKVTHHYNTTYKKYVPYYKGETIPEVKYPYKGEQSVVQKQPGAETPATLAAEQPTAEAAQEPAVAPAEETPVAQQAVQPVAQPVAQQIAQPAVEQPAAQTVSPNEVQPTSEVASPEETVNQNETQSASNPVEGQATDNQAPVTNEVNGQDEIQNPPTEENTSGEQDAGEQGAPQEEATVASEDSSQPGTESSQPGTELVPGNENPEQPSSDNTYVAQDGDVEIVNDGEEESTGKVDNSGALATQEQLNQENSLSPNNGITSLEDLPPDFWDSGYWVSSKAFTKNGDYYYETNNPEKKFRLTADESNPEQIKPIELQGLDSENKNWWKLANYKGNGQWEPLSGMDKVDDADTWLQNLAVDLEAQVKDLQAKLDAANKQLAEIPQEAAATLNTNTQLNYRLKSVIDSPDIQKQIDASPNGINYVGLNGDKISLITMGESLDFPIEIPSFLYKKLTEAKEVEISSIGSGGKTNLNVFLTPEIQEYLKTQKGNPNITKVMLGKDGLVWLMDDKNNPYLLDGMNVNDNVPAKDQKDNSVNVFINNGGANGNGQNGNGQANQQAAAGTGETTSSNEPYGEITQQTTVSELNALKGKLNERLAGTKEKIQSSFSEINSSLKEVGLQASLKDIKLSSPVKGTVLQDNKDWAQFSIKEAAENKTNTANAEKEEKKEQSQPTQTLSGDTEIYVIEEFYIKPSEEAVEETGEEVTEESAQGEETVTEGGDQSSKSNMEESIESYFFSVLKEAQELLREELNSTEEESSETDEEGTDEEANGTEEETEEQSEEDKAKEEAEKQEKKKQIISQSISAILRVSSSEVVSALNGSNGITLSTKTNDKTTFTGRKVEDVQFTFGPGDESKSGFKMLDEKQGLYKGWFTFVVAKGNAQESKGTKFNRFMNRAVGVADVMNKLSGGTPSAAEV